MATSTPTVGNRKVVGALFDNPKKARAAADELIKDGFGAVMVVEPATYPRGKEAERREALEEWGFNEPDVVYLDRDMGEGKLLVKAEVDKDQVPQVIQILNKNGSHYNPDGSRNMRDDVVAMTGGAAGGAALGAAVGGPVGAVVGAVVGAAAGGAVGTGIEDSQ